jgi:hypothetical protein
MKFKQLCDLLHERQQGPRRAASLRYYLNEMRPSDRGRVIRLSRMLTAFRFRDEIRAL